MITLHRFPCALVLANLLIAGQALAQTAAAPRPVTAGDVATRPLEDVNVRKDKIAPVLEAALAAPYTLPGKGRCAALNSEVARLNDALGPDIDAMTPQTRAQKREQVVGGTARSLVGSLIPFDGLVRQISGADAAAAHRALFIYAGSARRAFLKGYASARGCRIRPIGQPAAR